MLKKIFATNPKSYSNSTDVDSKRYINNYLLSQDKYLDYSCLSIIFLKNIFLTWMSIYGLISTNSLGTVFAN